MEKNAVEQNLILDKAREIIGQIRLMTRDFPSHEEDGLAEQMIETAISLAAFIKAAENESPQDTECENPFVNAHNSLLYLQTQYRLAVDLKYTRKNEKIEELLMETGGMLCSMTVPAMLSAIN